MNKKDGERRKMKYQTAAEYLKERMIKMYEKKCPLCGNTLDPEEKCKCQLRKTLEKFALSGEPVNMELTKIDLNRVVVTKVRDQEVIVKDAGGRISGIDLDSIVDVY